MKSDPIYAPLLRAAQTRRGTAYIPTDDRAAETHLFVSEDEANDEACTKE